jgi:hypothetical protein
MIASWTWKKADDKLFKLDEFIRHVNQWMKKLENSFGIVTTTVQAAATFGNGATTPSVALASVFKSANTAPTTITNFLGGDQAKLFTLIAGDANTTIKHDATKIKTKTGADRVLSLGHTTQFVTYDGVIWQEVPTP